jgi:hypothetical protein
MRPGWGAQREGCRGPLQARSATFWPFSGPCRGSCGATGWLRPPSYYWPQSVSSSASATRVHSLSPCSSQQTQCSCPKTTPPHPPCCIPPTLVGRAPGRTKQRRKQWERDGQAPKRQCWSEFASCRLETGYDSRRWRGRIYFGAARA